MTDFDFNEDVVEFSGEAELKLESEEKIDWDQGGKVLSAFLGAEENAFPIASKVFGQADVIYRFNGREVGRLSRITVLLFSQGSIAVTCSYRTPVKNHKNLNRWIRLTHRGSFLHQSTIQGILRSRCGTTVQNSFTGSYPSHLFERVDGAFFGMSFAGNMC